jgi:hypothetical protein
MDRDAKDAAALLSEAEEGEGLGSGGEGDVAAAGSTTSTAGTLLSPKSEKRAERKARLKLHNMEGAAMVDFKRHKVRPYR